MLGGLEFRAVGGLVDQPDAIGNREVFRAVPAGVIESEENDAVAPGAGHPRESFEQFGKEWLVDAVRQIPDGLSAHELQIFPILPLYCLIFFWDCELSHTVSG